MNSRIDVFISYKREERALSKRVKRGIIAAGYTAVTDLNIGKNEDFSDAIDTMIRTATLTLVLWTKASAPSDWVRKEARLARDLEKAGKPNRYLGVMIEDVDLDLPPDLRGLQMVDIRDSGLDDPSMAQLVDAVRDILGDEAQRNAQIAGAHSAALAEEWQLYDLACSINVAASFKSYLARYPNGEFSNDARRQLGMFTWYLHPFRRGNMSNTIAAMGIVGTIIATVWGASRDLVLIGVDPDKHIAAVAERDTAIRRAEKLEEEIDTADTQARRAASAQAEAETALREAEARAETLDEEISKPEAQTQRAAAAQSEVAITPNDSEQQDFEILGLKLRPLTSEMREEIKEHSDGSNNDGLYVMNVRETSQAYEKGLRVGDVIVEADQNMVNSEEAFERSLELRRNAGRNSLLLLLYRSGEPRFLSLRVDK